MGFDYRRDASGIVVVTMDMDGQSANTMSPVYHDEMGATVARLEAEEDLIGVVFASAKKTFFAGGDLHGLLQAETGDDAYKAWLNEDKGFLRRLEKLPVPVVAAINGAALGGGFEICLSCNHRIIVDDPAAVVGLPEVTLGLLPGAGGVARLPRVLPLDQALDLLLSGRFVQPAEALSLGLVHRIVAAPDDLIPAAMAWIKSTDATARQPWDAAPRALPAGDLTVARALVQTTRDAVLQRTRGKMPAPLRILDIVQQGLELDLDRNLLVETENFAALLGLPETRAAISLNFFAANAVRSGKLRPEGARTKTGAVTIIGAGPQAGAMATAAARKMVVNGADTAGGQGVILAFAGADLPQDFACGGVELTAARPALPADHPAQLFGFRLPPAMAQSGLVELVAGAQTDNHTLCLAYDLFQRIGRTPIIVQDRPGHFIARLSAACLNEALSLWHAGLAPERIDQLAYDAGFVALPSDLLGAASQLVQTQAATPVLDLLAAALGARPDWDGLADIARAPDAQGAAQAADRLLYIQSIEALRCLADGTVTTEQEADLASVLGAGFPPHTGGVVQFIKGIGAQAFAARAAELAALYGSRFALTPDVTGRLPNPEYKAA